MVLPGADLALEQAVHRRVLRELRGQGLADGGLAGGQREGQLPVERGQQSLRGGAAGGGLLGGELGAAPGEGRLEHQGFLVAEPVPGALPVGRGLRGVDEPVGVRDRQELLPGRDLRRQRVRQDLQVHGVQQRGDDLLDGPAGQLGGGRIHRDGHGGELLRVHARGVRVLVQQQEVGVGQPQGAAVPGDLSGEHGAAPRLQLGFGPETVEEAHLQGAGSPVPASSEITTSVSEPRRARMARVLLETTRAIEGDFLVERDLADGGEFAAVQVPAGEVVQQPAHRGDAEVLFNDGRGTLADPAFQAEVRVRRCPRFGTAQFSVHVRPGSAARQARSR